MNMKCLTVHQPWAWAILHGKQVENRTRRISYRGLVAIHAGLIVERTAQYPGAGDGDPWAEFRALGGFSALWDVRFPPRGADLHPGMALGAVIAVADLDGCHPGKTTGGGCSNGGELCSPWAVEGMWHWQLANVRPLGEPVIVRGQQGVWNLPPAVEAQVRAQIEGNP